MGGDLLGDFGARDPFPAELESGFAEKVLGNVSTEHKILIPSLTALSLSQQQCDPHISPLQPPMSEDDAAKLLKKVDFSCYISFVCVYLNVCMVFDEITEWIGLNLTLYRSSWSSLRELTFDFCWCWMKEAFRKISEI